MSKNNNSAKPFKVLIPTAGLGSRTENLSKNINKALISIAHKPIISYIIEKFPKNAEFVIPLGYKGDTVKSFLKLAYPDRSFIFVDIDLYEGEGSGLGYTMMKCQDHLQEPFIFNSNDTMVLEEIIEPRFNWMGYAETENNNQYRSVRIEQEKVVEICAKGAMGDTKAYIGLAGIYDYEIFWDSMNEGAKSGSIEIGESFGLRNLINKTIKAKEYSWFDTGNLEEIQKTRDFFSNNIENNIDANILEKQDEAIWFVDKTVIKFSIDDEFILNRVKRSKNLSGYIPKIVNSTNNMYSYKKVDGEVFSRNPTVPKFKKFLEGMESFWEPKVLDNDNTAAFYNNCMIFYKEKTYSRVKQFLSTFEQIDIQEEINGRKIPKLFDMLDSVDWDNLSKGTPVRFHGDLHFENILLNADNNSNLSFTLLDWRQDFGGNMEYGDLYYDLGKLNHGIIMSHELIDKNLFEVKHSMNKIHFDFHRKQNLVDCQVFFKAWILENNLDYGKVQLMTALIFLNIAALHHYPYSLLLFYLGKSMLFDPNFDTAER